MTLIEQYHDFSQLTHEGLMFSFFPFVHPQKIIYAQFIVKATEFLNMNLVHFGVRLNHFYSCDHSGIN